MQILGITLLYVKQSIFNFCSNDYRNSYFEYFFKAVELTCIVSHDHCSSLLPQAAAGE